MSKAFDLTIAIDRAFASVPRPARFTTCDCDECQETSRRLRAKARESLTCADLEASVCLLSPEGLTYLAPALMRMCLETTPDSPCDACEHFVDLELSQPLAQDAFPVMHPRFSPLTAEQTEVILAFLEHVSAIWYPNEAEPPRPLKRAIANWSRFAGRSSP